MSDYVPNYKIIQSYVHYQGKCFFVSTIERNSSSAYNPCRFNETLVWDYDYDKRERGDIIHSDEDIKGSIQKHLDICDLFFKNGRIENE